MNLKIRTEKIGKFTVKWFGDLSSFRTWKSYRLRRDIACPAPYFNQHVGPDNFQLNYPITIQKVSL